MTNKEIVKKIEALEEEIEELKTYRVYHYPPVFYPYTYPPPTNIPPNLPHWQTMFNTTNIQQENP